MSRGSRAKIAEQTLAILEAGHYECRGQTVPLAAALADCVDRTRQFSPEELATLVATSSVSESVPGRIELRNETTLQAVADLYAAGERDVAALNFASARNPGGGFLGGSQAQEESLARSSALYPSLMRAWPYYEHHRLAKSLLYTDAAILSPECPVFRDDDGSLLPVPHPVHFITCAAPNAGAVRARQPEDASRVPEVLLRRAEGVLALAASQRYPVLVLGAWGCGVFQNDPRVVAGVFRELLLGARQWARRFSVIRLAVFDAAPQTSTFAAFEQAFPESRAPGAR
jgi:uncharacterized protein (TIGR02452 family)